MVKRIEARAEVGAGDLSAMNFVNLYEMMIKELTESGEEVDVVKTRMAIQQAYGQPLNPKEMSAFEFAQVMELVKEQAARRTTKNRNGKS